MLLSISDAVGVAVAAGSVCHCEPTGLECAPWQRGGALAFPSSVAYIFASLRRFRMSVFTHRSGLALVLAALCLAGRTACAQTADVTYSSWPIGFHSNLTVGQRSNTYGSFAGFDGSDARGFSTMRTNFPNGWFVGGGTSGLGFGINQASAFGTSLHYEGVQAGYNFQNLGGLPVTVYAGFDTLEYNTGIGSPLAPFDSTSGTLPGYRAHAGVEFQAAPNVSLSLGVGYTQQPARIDSDFNLLALPGASAFGRR
jgi:opacity protein-like surface antigen